MELFSLLEALSTLEWVIFSVVSNILLFVFSVGLYLFIDKTCSKNKLQHKDHPIYRSDLCLSILTIGLNSIVMLLGVYLWKNGLLLLHPDRSAKAILLELIAIVFIMDFLMYVFHFLAHIPWVYQILHRKHHEHTSTNYLSLFVLHPLESLGFGLMMIIVFLCYNFSVYSISSYIMINLIWGTVGHLNREFFPNWTERLFLGTTKFHNQHHLCEQKNFGFYTSIWDRFFGTFKP